MKHLIFLSIFYLLAFAADNSKDTHYPSEYGSVHFYPSKSFQSFGIDGYLNNTTRFNSSDPIMNFDVLPCVTLAEGTMEGPLSKKSMLHLQAHIQTKYVYLEFAKKTLNILPVNGTILSYSFIDHSSPDSKITSKSLALKDESMLLDCVEIDNYTGALFLGTGDGRILEYSTINNKWGKEYKASEYVIDGIWLYGHDKQMMLFSSANYFYLMHRQDDKPRVRIKKPSYISKSYFWNGETNKLVFSHAESVLPLVGQYVSTKYDKDFVIVLPNFFVKAEGLSYHHCMFLNTLREICKLKKENIKSTNEPDLKKHTENKERILEYQSKLREKGHAWLFEPMVAAVFKNDLCD